MRILRNLVARVVLALCFALALVGPMNAPVAQAGTGATNAAVTVSDYLYVGDGADNTVKRFDANTGAYAGIFVSSASAGLHGPRGMVFKTGYLFVVNQNVGFDTLTGAILKFSASTGASAGALVAACDSAVTTCPDALPFAPRGLVGGPNQTFFVADQSGKASQFDATGKWLGDLPLPNIQVGDYSGPPFPRALVMGPDGYLYMSARGPDAATGMVLRFNARTRQFVDTYISNSQTSDCSQNLHRPEGLVFGPDGRLYMVAPRLDPSETDKILIFKGNACADYIDLDVPNAADANRVTAQALLFGPGGDLFVPITNVVGETQINNQYTGAVRRYNVKNKTFTNFVPPAAGGGHLASPWYLTFGKADANTLAYGG